MLDFLGLRSEAKALEWCLHHGAGDMPGFMVMRRRWVDMTPSRNPDRVTETSITVEPSRRAPG